MTAHPNERRIAYFISPHGFGHAARAAAVIEAVQALDPRIGFELFTLVPEWLFLESLSRPFGYHAVLTDIGMVQSTSLDEDLPETVRRLGEMVPFDPASIRELARSVVDAGCRAVVCDIAPMGIAVAREAGLASVLVENFTWDWIYEGYLEREPGLARFAEALGELFRSADLHVQTDPVCRPTRADLRTPPIARERRAPDGAVRRELAIGREERVVLVTMGGIGERYRFVDELASWPDAHFVIPGGERRERIGRNVTILPQASGIFHPDLVNASDAVVGKIGYSTLGEVYWAGVPFGYVRRRRFRESPVLAAYADRHMPSVALDEEELRSGRWLSRVDELLALPRARRDGPNGATAVAELLVGLVG